MLRERGPGSEDDPLVPQFHLSLVDTRLPHEENNVVLRLRMVRAADERLAGQRWGRATAGQTLRLRSAPITRVIVAPSCGLEWDASVPQRKATKWGRLSLSTPMIQQCLIRE